MSVTNQLFEGEELSNPDVDCNNVLQGQCDNWPDDLIVFEKMTLFHRSTFITNDRRKKKTIKLTH